MNDSVMMSHGYSSQRWWMIAISFIICHLSFSPLRAQTVATDSIVQVLDSMYRAIPVDSILRSSGVAYPQPLPKGGELGEHQASASLVADKIERNMDLWRPNPKKALWLALVIPGGGQIYNRKYWKLPIVYGGFIGCIYALRWNNMMYKSYAQAFLDITDDDPGTASYNAFMHLGRVIDKSNEERYKTIFKKRKDRFRRYRDLSFFVMLGVYAISVIDAYVDAELSEFDISKDLSLKLSPAVIGNGNSSHNPLTAASIGLNCSINF